MATRRSRPPWWEGAVIYQCYPRSFADANGDGIGDLEGITRHLDHLAGSDYSLGADAIWLSPVYPHGGVDGGYDIIDHAAIAPEFGSLHDLDRLVAEAHDRNLRVLMDLVVGHVSHQHPWFHEARASRTAARRDWFIWADPRAGGEPPNNWIAIFGGPAWTLERVTGQFYHHTYYPEQPDLNWRNPEVQAAVANILRFWLDRGVDGFRVDAAQNLVKDAALRDNPPARREWHFQRQPGGLARRWNSHLPGNRRVLRGFRRVLDEYPDRFLLGEIYAPPRRLATYLAAGGTEGLHASLDMELGLSDWSARAFIRAIERAERHLQPPLYPTWNLSNHDVPRHGSRWGPERARLAALLTLTLRGLICLYYGEEIGMTDHPAVPTPMFDRWGRDPERTPMQWSSDPLGGFTKDTPWLPLNDPKRTNVDDQRADPGSLLTLYRRLIELRRRSPALQFGSLELLAGLPRGVIGWERRSGRQRVVVVGNMGPRTAVTPLPGGSMRVALATGTRSASVRGAIELESLEGLVLRPA